MLLVASPTTPNLPSGPIPLSWLQKQPFVTFPSHSPTRHAIDAVFRRLRIDPPLSLEVANPVVLVEAVAAGRGISILPLSSVIGELERGELLHLACPEVEFHRPICILLHRRRAHTRATRALAIFLSTNLPQARKDWIDGNH
jgi:DNA-binding transcriptional LysR family regulator